MHVKVKVLYTLQAMLNIPVDLQAVYVYMQLVHTQSPPPSTAAASYILAANPRTEILVLTMWTTSVSGMMQCFTSRALHCQPTRLKSLVRTACRPAVAPSRYQAINPSCDSAHDADHGARFRQNRLCVEPVNHNYLQPGQSTLGACSRDAFN